MVLRKTATEQQNLKIVSDRPKNLYIEKCGERHHSNRHIKSIRNTKLELKYLPAEQKMSSATVRALKTLQAAHLKGNVPVLASSQNERVKRNYSTNHAQNPPNASAELIIVCLMCTCNREKCFYFLQLILRS